MMKVSFWSLRVERIAIDAPADGPVAKPDAAQFMDGAGELGVVFYRDDELHRDTHRTSQAGVFQTVLRHRDEVGRGALPLVRRVVGEGTLQNVEAIDHRQSHQHAALPRAASASAVEVCSAR